MEEFWFRLLVPQEFEAFEVCRVIWTWYIGIGLLPMYFRVSPSYESPTDIIMGLLIAMVFFTVFAFSVGIVLFRIQNLLPIVHNPFIASVIIFINASLPLAIGAKVMDKV